MILSFASRPARQHLAVALASLASACDTEWDAIRNAFDNAPLAAEGLMSVPAREVQYRDQRDDTDEAETSVGVIARRRSVT
jgi:hypothetical protein